MNNEFLKVKESILIKALNTFDGNLVDKVLSDNCLNLENLHISVESKTDRNYSDFMYHLNKKIDELLEEDKKNSDPDHEARNKDKENPIWKTMD